MKDIHVLATYFASHFAEQTNKKNLQYSKDFLKRLESYAWQSNIRELKNVIERGAIISDDVLEPESLPSELQQSLPVICLQLSMESVEKLHIQKVLNYSKGNKAETARLLEIGIPTLYRKIEEYELNSG